MRVVFALQTAFQFGKVSAGTEREAELGGDVTDTVFVAFTHYGVIVFIEIDVTCRVEIPLIPNGDDGRLVQDLLRDGEMEFAADARRAVYGDETAHTAYQRLCDGKTETDAAFFSAASCINLAETGKDFFQIGAIDADAGVFDAHGQVDAVFLAAALDAQDHAAFLRKFDGIFQQVDDDAPKLLLVAQQVAWQIRVAVHDQFQMLAVIHGQRHIDDVGDGGGNVVAFLRKFQFSGFQFRKIQNVADGCQEVSPGSLDIHHIPPHFQRKVFLQNRFAHAAHGIDGGTDLVRDID